MPDAKSLHSDFEHEQDTAGIHHAMFLSSEYLDDGTWWLYSPVVSGPLDPVGFAMFARSLVSLEGACDYSRHGARREQRE